MERTFRHSHHGPIISEDRSKNVAYAAPLAGLETMNLARIGSAYFNAERTRSIVPILAEISTRAIA